MNTPPLVALERPACRQLFVLFQAGGAAPGQTPGLAFLRASRLSERNLVVCREIDGPDAVLTWLRAFVAGRPHIDELYCLGSSMGAIAALVVGHHLPARMVWAFSPAPRPPPELHLPALLGRGDGGTRHEVYFHTDDRVEVDCPIICRELAGCPGVTLYPRAGATHLSAADLGDELVALLPPYRGRS